MYFDAVLLVRSSFIGAAVIVLISYLVPAFRSRFLDYGARSSTADQSSAEEEKRALLRSSGVASVLDSLAKIKVPHSWFTSFYAVSVGLSLLWVSVLPLRSHLRDVYLLDHRRPSMSITRTKLAWFLMLCQGVRRLAECLLLSEPSKSTMWAGHWLVGLFFYVGMSVAIWIEGVPALLKHEFSVHDLEIAFPDLQASIFLLLFLLASGIQHDCHAYLASLKKKSYNPKTSTTDYRFPDFPAFSICLTPHYLMECLIYLSLAGLAAPAGQWANATILCALAFVVTNLGVTAVGTRRWYARKFGKDAVKGRAAMIPYIL
ncbi:hypothetical protein AMS68_001159 [Peltaster fructicola]|uniref:Polyprenal reductase n=1 Tax=Peltaster fructicola TaxID=286661 RepID=A0A6H0XLL5_9PEZI|nr:hypothetical protein AMS68_001159 [Peltaster fructicola]